MRTDNSQKTGRLEHESAPSLIYIAGAKFSGSTLLDLMLDQHSRLESAGEVISLDRWIENRWLCSCSVPIQECDYWRRIVGSDRIVSGEPILGQLTLARRRWLRFFPPSRRSARQYGERNRLLLEAIQTATNRDIVVDSSKSLPRLKLLYRSGLINLGVIHLVRDGRGQFYSQIRKRPPPADRSRRLPRRSKLRMLLNWWLINHLIRRAIHRMRGVPSITVRYEDLARQPEQELRRICERFGLEFESAMSRPSTVDIHNISGNQWRFERKEQVPIRVDEKWRRKLTRIDRILYWIVAARLNRALGYPES